MSQTPDFIVSVADVFAFDPNTGDLLFETQTNTNTSFEITMADTESRGGFGNELLFKYYHTRTVNMTIESNTWEQNWLASNVGATIATQSENAIKKECVTLVGNDGTLTQTPVGDIFVQGSSSNAWIRITPVGNDFTVPSLTDEKVTVNFFSTESTAEVINVNAGDSPQILRLILRVPQFNQAGINGTLEIEIPRFQVSGEFSIALTPDSIQSSMLSGMALAFPVDNGADACDTNAYAIVRVIPTDANVAFGSLVSLVGDSNSVDAPDTGGNYQINTLGIIGGLFRNVPVANDDANLAYAMEAGSDADITVSTTGLITVAGTASAGDAGTVIVTYSGQTPNLTAEVNVDVV